MGLLDSQYCYFFAHYTTNRALNQAVFVQIRTKCAKNARFEQKYDFFIKDRAPS
jgi:hypothetical protein